MQLLTFEQQGPVSWRLLTYFMKLAPALHTGEINSAQRVSFHMTMSNCVNMTIFLFIGLNHNSFVSSGFEHFAYAFGVVLNLIRPLTLHPYFKWAVGACWFYSDKRQK